MGTHICILFTYMTTFNELLCVRLNNKHVIRFVNSCCICCMHVHQEQQSVPCTHTCSCKILTRKIRWPISFILLLFFLVKLSPHALFFVFIFIQHVRVPICMHTCTCTKTSNYSLFFIFFSLRVYIHIHLWVLQNIHMGTHIYNFIKFMFTKAWHHSNLARHHYHQSASFPHMKTYQALLSFP